MMGGERNKKLVRPKTAATSNRKDELRIKKKMQILENIERKIDEDILEFNSKRDNKKQARGEKISKKLILEAS